MKKREAEGLMEKFRDRKIHVLVSTTVIEVGIDVPSANVMVIEHAERFGLSQLHQLRGRIGRGERDALCVLVADPQTEEADKRMKAMLKTDDGFKIAEYDLEIRGPGKFFGRHQHGLNELKVANPVTQIDVLKQARDEAQGLLKNDPQLREANHRNILSVIQRRYPTYLADVEAG